MYTSAPRRYYRHSSGNRALGRDDTSQGGGDTMKVDRVTAALRYSAEAKGTWRTVELGAEADVASMRIGKQRK
jgi:hypothetical protein